MFRQKQPRQFQYKGRVNKDQLEEQDTDFSSQWEALKTSKRKRKSLFFNSLPFFVIALTALLVLWYILSLY